MNTQPPTQFVANDEVVLTENSPPLIKGDYRFVIYCSPGQVGKTGVYGGNGDNSLARIRGMGGDSVVPVRLLRRK